MCSLELKAFNWLKELGWGQEQLQDLRLLAYAFLRQGLYDYAITLLEAVTILQPSHSFDYQALGALYLQTGKAKEALPWLDKAIFIDPNHLPTHLNRAKALLAIGSKQRGLRLARSLLKVADPTVVRAAEALLMAHGVSLPTPTATPALKADNTASHPLRSSA